MRVMGPWLLRDAFLDLEGRTYEDKNYFANAGNEQEYNLEILKNNFELYELLHKMYSIDDNRITDHLNKIYDELITGIVLHYRCVMEDLSEDNPWKKRQAIRLKKEEE